MADLLTVYVCLHPVLCEKKGTTLLRQWQIWLEMGNVLAQTDKSVCAYFKSTRLFDKNNNLQNAASSIG